MPRFFLCLIERDSVTDDLEGLAFVDMPAAIADAVRQIRRMVSLEMIETGRVNLDRAIEIVGDGGAHRRIPFSDAITVSA